MELGFRRTAAGRRKHQIQQAVSHGIQGLALRHRTGVKVDPAPFFLKKGGITGDFYRWSRGPKGGAAAGGKENEVGAGSGEGGV